MTVVLEVDDLRVRYGRIRALEGVHLAVDEGAVVTVLGRNGAGKSTLLGAVAGTVRPASGKVLLQGRDVTRQPADRRARLGLALVPEGRRIFPNITVAENLLLGGFARSAEERRLAMDRIAELFPILSERAAFPAAQLSGGEQQILAIARAMMGSPRVLLLDEPSLGLAPKVVDEVYTQLGLLRRSGIAMVLVEQHVSQALAFADHAVVLNLGRVVLADDPARLREDPRLLGAYMGAEGG